MSGYIYAGGSAIGEVMKLLPFTYEDIAHSLGFDEEGLELIQGLAEGDVDALDESAFGVISKKLGASFVIGRDVVEPVVDGVMLVRVTTMDDLGRAWGIATTTHLAEYDSIAFPVVDPGTGNASLCVLVGREETWDCAIILISLSSGIDLDQVIPSLPGNVPRPFLSLDKRYAQTFDKTLSKAMSDCAVYREVITEYVKTLDAALGEHWTEWLGDMAPESTTHPYSEIMDKAMAAREF